MMPKKKRKPVVSDLPDASNAAQHVRELNEVAERAVRWATNRNMGAILAYSNASDSVKLARDVRIAALNDLLRVIGRKSCSAGDLVSIILSLPEESHVQPQARP